MATTSLFTLQALQINGTWYSLSTHETLGDAEDAKRERGGWKHRGVKYRVIRG